MNGKENNENTLGRGRDIRNASGKPPRITHQNVLRDVHKQLGFFEVLDQVLGRQVGNSLHVRSM